MLRILRLSIGGWCANTAYVRNKSINCNCAFHDAECRLCVLCCCCCFIAVRMLNNAGKLSIFLYVCWLNIFVFICGFCVFIHFPICTSVLVWTGFSHAMNCTAQCTSIEIPWNSSIRIRIGKLYVEGILVIIVKVTFVVAEYACYLFCHSYDNLCNEFS